VKEGETISKKVADALVKLGIKPMDVGLVLQAAYYRDTIFTPDLLAIDEEAYHNNIVLAAQQAFNLSVNAVIPTRLTISAIIGKAVREARNVASRRASTRRGSLTSSSDGHSSRCWPSRS